MAFTSGVRDKYRAYEAFRLHDEKVASDLLQNLRRRAGSTILNSLPRSHAAFPARPPLLNDTVPDVTA